jgi:antitoxin (DNA-binding transcriptional repressor) of toxin-antitoxin stability system
MVTKIEWHDAQRRIAEFVERAAKGERFLVEKGDTPIAAFVGPDDLSRLEDMDSQAQNDGDRRQRRYRELLVEAGITVTRPAHPASAPIKRSLISVEGVPISEQILADRS